MSKRDLARGLKALRDSAEAYQEADDVYTGEIEEFFSNAKLKAALQGTGDRFRYNFAAIVVDRLADRWKPGALKAKNAALDAALEAWWHDNTLDEDLDGWLRNAAKFGDYFVTVWPGETEATNEGSERVLTVETFGNSPLTTRLMYSRENTRKPVFAIRVWQTTVVDAENQDGQERVRVNLSYADVIEQYISTNEARVGAFPTNASAYELYDDPDSDDDDELGMMENPFGIIPVFHFRVGSKPYGTPVHKRAFGPQNAINKIVVTHMSTIDQLGAPQRYGLIDPSASAMSDDFGETFGDDADAIGAAANALPTGAVSKMRAGEFWYLEGLKAVGQFEAAGAAPFLEPMDAALRAMAALTYSPLSDFGLEDKNGVAKSGEAKRRDAAAQVARAEKEAVGLGRVVENMAETVLLMLGYEGERVELDWLPADVSTDSDGMDLVGKKISNGVPVDVALKEAGYPAAEVEEWWPEGTPAYPISILDKLAAALQALGAAKTLGVVQDADIAAIVPGVFLAARTEGDRTVKSATPEVDAEQVAPEA